MASLNGIVKLLVTDPSVAEACGWKVVLKRFLKKQVVINRINLAQVGV
jgi:hypothetical protein